MGSTDLKVREKREGATPVYIDGPTGVFGTVDVSTIKPQVQADFAHNILNDLLVTTNSYGGAGSTVANGLASANTGVVASSWAIIEGRRSIRYRPGQGSLCRLTALFDTAVANNLQLAGIGNAECGYFFGYNGTSFGIIHIPTSQLEIRRLEITTAATTGGTVTVTLDGSAISVTGVSALADTAAGRQQTAYEIATKGDFSQAGDQGFYAAAIGNYIYFNAKRPNSTSGGTYSVSGGGVAGTFTQIKAGIDPTINFTPQSQWNIDRADGTGPTGFTLDPTKGNVYAIHYQYLGFGNAIFMIEDPETGKFFKVHEIKNANSRTTPVLKNPNASVLIGSFNTGNTSAVSVKTASMSGFIEGDVVRLDPKFAKDFSFSGLNTSSAWRPLAILRTRRVYNDETCFGELDFLRLGATNNANNQTLTVGLFRRATITGNATVPVNFQYVNETRSIAAYAELAPGASGNTISNIASIEPLFQFVVGGNSAVGIDIESLNIIGAIGDPIVIAVKTDGSISGNVSVNWFEQQ